MTTFITADLHLGHKNILQHAERPFATVEDMDDTLIRNWNWKVTPSDEVYVLGDVVFQDPMKYLPDMNGKKYLIIGNHDYRWLKKLEPHFEWMKDLHLLKKDGKEFMLCHYAMRTWCGSNRGNVMLHGHSHGQLPKWPDSLDVGVDAHQMYPITLRQAYDLATGEG